MIGVESLRPVKVLYEGDLAVLLLKLHDAKEEQTGYRGRPTVHGVASAYARLMIDISQEHIESLIRGHGCHSGRWSSGARGRGDGQSTGPG